MQWSHHTSTPYHIVTKQNFSKKLKRRISKKRNVDGLTTDSGVPPMRLRSDTQLDTPLCKYQTSHDPLTEIPTKTPLV